MKRASSARQTTPSLSPFPLAMLKFLSLLLCCIAVACAARAPRIRFGRPVTAGELSSKFKFLVSVYACGRNGMCSACTGSVVSANRVLLAAHCLCGDMSGGIKVFFQTLNAGRGSDSTTARVLKQKPFRCDDNRSYQANVDVAVLQLDKATSHPAVQLECSHQGPGTRVTMIGYGKDERGGSGLLRIGQRATEKCDGHYAQAYCVDGNDRQQTSTDHGDSGGPLLIQKGGGYVQIGVTHGATTVFSRVQDTTILWADVGPHCNWIRG